MSGTGASAGNVSGYGGSVAEWAAGLSPAAAQMSPANAGGDMAGRRFAHEDVDVANTLLKMQQSTAAAAVEHAVRQQQHAMMQAGKHTF
jgi:hypothetical protein